MTGRRTRTKRRTNQDNYRPPFNRNILSQPIENLKFNVNNTLELLKKANINTIGDALIREEKDFYRIYTFKKRNLLDVKNALTERKLHLKPNTPKDKKIPTNKRAPRRQTVQKDRFVKVCKNGKWGFSNRRNIVIEPKYDEVFTFKEELCCVEKDGLFGFIDREGKEVIPLMYQCALSFSQGLACVYKDDKCGYINKDNEIVIDFAYDAGTPIENGNCRVKRDGKWGELWLDNIKEIRWIN